jgi:hypothetical protein
MASEVSGAPGGPRGQSDTTSRRRTLKLEVEGYEVDFDVDTRSRTIVVNQVSRTR